MRSRDKSYYEQFINYHNTFYKHVEPTSVTPYSYRAVEKALHAVYVALIRHKVRELRANDAAKDYRTSNTQAKAIKQFILERIQSIDATALSYAGECIENFEAIWEESAKRIAGNFCYSLRGENPNNKYTLLVEAEKENLSVFPSTLNTLRNVDTSSNVFIINREREVD